MSQKLAKENMSENLITIGWNEHMENAYRRMQLKKVRHLPVLDDAGTVVGVLSDRDVQRAMISGVVHQSGQLLADETIDFDPEAMVRDYMSWPVQSVEVNTELKKVAERMINAKISSALVCEGKTAVGIITAEDLLKVLVELLNNPGTPVQWRLDQIMDGLFWSQRPIA